LRKSACAAGLARRKHARVSRAMLRVMGKE
jgi:hypothetical protein